MAEEITCLGKKFASEDERREYFRNELRKKLPELKKIDGFPIGEDEDIIALSDPPYFTACPNPWLEDFITIWSREQSEMESKGIRKTNFEVKDPYASDISEGKYHPIYYKHPYHTKVPHIAIMKYLLHYTQPGDIILDPFAGTGMTGLASQMLEDPDIETRSSLGLRISQNNSLGRRHTIFGDLSPAASFIGYYYNYPLSNEKALNKVENVLNEISSDFKWMFETNHSSNAAKGIINNVIWSDVFICDQCNSDIIFWEDSVDQANGIILEQFQCKKCKTILNKKGLKRKFRTFFDNELKKVVKQSIQVPVEISYNYRGRKYKKKPDSDDLELISKIENYQIINWIPLNELYKGDKMGEPLKLGFTNVHHLYSKRNLIVLSEFRNRIGTNVLMGILTAVAFRITKRYALTYQSGQWGAGGGPTNGTYYIPSLVKELNIVDMLDQALKKYIKASINSNYTSVISSQSATSLQISSNSVDYIFVDPPFGSNLIYSEINFVWESWLKVFTHVEEEAIESKSQKKDLFVYRNIILKSFKECFRVLKPGKWMTVEFSNTKASVWNIIQYCIQNAGFIIANVSALDKQKGSYNAQTTPTSVKQELVISCYKPSLDFEHIFKMADSQYAIWDFINEHLNHIPTYINRNDENTLIIERTPRILYDRLISFFIIKGLSVPVDSKDFQFGLKQKFIERDGMYFTKEQVVEYDDFKATHASTIQVSWLVSNESEGIGWLKSELNGKKLKYQDIQPKWMQAITAVRKGDILPELRDILQQNFIEESDGSWRVPDMNEAKDREIIRNKALLKEFNNYVELANNPKSKRMKEVRVEALRAGFKQCWDTKDFQTIVKISDKIPQNLLLEDEQLLMYYDIAKDRV
jgi:DNA modification methylase